MGKDPLSEAARIADILLGRRYVSRKLDDERRSFKKIREEYVDAVEEDKGFLKLRNVINVKWPE